MRVEEAIKWLNSFERYGSVYGLERISRLVESLGNPHHAYKVIHIAGSNGKGSVCRYISSILSHAGYRTGLYLSPHLERFNERISIDNIEITDEELRDAIVRVKPIAEGMMKDNARPTYFEIVTAIAFLYFKEKGVEYSVVETGLGGRLDATNIVEPVLTIITNISLEHTDILGPNIESIAREKAGIIKKGVPVLTAAKEPARSIIGSVADRLKAPFIPVDETCWRRIDSTIKGQVFHIRGGIRDYHVYTRLLGLHQGENIALALRGIEELQLKGLYITDKDITDGVADTTHPGRLEVLSDKPLVIIDGAHNPDGVDKLARTLEEDIKPGRGDLIVVFGVLKDKDIDSMLKRIKPLSKVFIVTKPDTTRACPPEIVYERIKHIGLDPGNVYTTRNVPEGIQLAERYLGDNDILCVTGSLYTVGEARKYIKKTGVSYHIC